MVPPKGLNARGRMRVSTALGALRICQPRKRTERHVVSEVPFGTKLPIHLGWGRLDDDHIASEALDCSSFMIKIQGLASMQRRMSGSCPYKYLTWQSRIHWSHQKSVKHINTKYISQSIRLSPVIIRKYLRHPALYVQTVRISSGFTSLVRLKKPGRIGPYDGFRIVNGIGGRLSG